ncbi:galanin peptides-like isoform X2 [Poecilia latipinna]|uniref:galanin peptides-like isoform X2 n=1 Tax=Poecilia latipinna TaxID=48699 RepID=UPI00072EDDBA|nr:PREDICTED: galanin peptides-like isoform X2 [Poecilia latipinna]
MQRCFGVFCVTLIFCATLSETIGLVIAAKEKRGWTLNSAGYLLGPRRIDHLIQIKDSPSARGRDELVTQCKIETYGRCRALAPGQELLFVNISFLSCFCCPSEDTSSCRSLMPPFFSIPMVHFCRCVKQKELSGT